MNTKNNQGFGDMDKKLKAKTLELLETTDFEKIIVKSLCETAPFKIPQPSPLSAPCTLWKNDSVVCSALSTGHTSIGLRP
ncbi:UNVERIFIED_CONTAM: hypothetical protein C7383_10852 [Murimonas intestini]|uniref:Uncharacterized protein n=1 Tax=Murimonas intestini TaxID=1337051 RepID=A0AB73T2S4_9FIRM